jgi:hypothetical protein
LGSPEIAVPLCLLWSVANTKLVIGLDRVSNGNGPLADDDIATVVTASGVDVAVLAGRNRGVPFIVPVVVEGDEFGAGQVLCRVAGAPCFTLRSSVSWFLAMISFL